MKGNIACAPKAVRRIHYTDIGSSGSVGVSGGTKRNFIVDESLHTTGTEVIRGRVAKESMLVK